MSDNLQMGQGSGSAQRGTAQQQRRPDRQASSCTECRRRKQKCSQGQPCTNCARRFPQPICDYETRTKSRRQGSRTSGGPASKVISKEGPYSHLNLVGIQDAILQVELRSDSDVAGPSANKRVHNDTSGWQLGWKSAAAPGHVGGDGPVYSGDLQDWFPFRLSCQDRDGNINRKSVLAKMKIIMDRRTSGAESDPADEWMADVAQLIWDAQSSRRPSLSISKLDDEMRHLPMAPTRLNKELVRTHLRLLSRFKASVGGNPEPDNPLMQQWVPFIIQDPLLIHTVLFTSACFLNETGHLPKTVVVAFRGLVYTALNENLRNGKSQTSDAAIYAVSDLVLNEWYWGSTSDLHAHMNGLRTMIRMRGGLQKLGMHGFEAKLILVHDITMGIAHETEPEMYGQAGFDFHDPVEVPFQVSLNTPFTSDWPSFVSCAGSLQIHSSAAQILDDTRAMFEAVLSLPEDATPEQVGQITSMASWVLGRIQDLPDVVSLQHGPITRGSPEEVSSETSSPTTARDASSPQVKDSPRSSPGLAPVAAGRKPIIPTTSQSPNGAEALDKLQVSAPDFLYSLIRKTAIVYCRAIIERKPTSQVCTKSEFMQIWGLSWKISMAGRRAIVGIFHWILMLLAPNCHHVPPARFIKALLTNAFMNMAVENWHFTMDTAKAILKLQRWLNGLTTADNYHSRVAIGGELVIEKHGFAHKEVLANISNMLKPDQGAEDEDENGEAPI